MVMTITKSSLWFAPIVQTTTAKPQARCERVAPKCVREVPSESGEFRGKICGLSVRWLYFGRIFLESFRNVPIPFSPTKKPTRSSRIFRFENVSPLKNKLKLCCSWKNHLSLPTAARSQAGKQSTIPRDSYSTGRMFGGGCSFAEVRGSCV